MFGTWELEGPGMVIETVAGSGVSAAEPASSPEHAAITELAANVPASRAKRPKGRLGWFVILSFSWESKPRFLGRPYRDRLASISDRRRRAAACLPAP
ncbi:hypothetical protein IFM12276_27410 [Nocardia sputorum]|uniref:Uncharacterized protein n=1 Tax=Nocardia sputorum TaxID=2984338 RepID=A0ABN6U381_9NOCA|nr:hypothetical protein IFM12276_27410 [Nocardia sputorum]